jgi:hypothetical protein
MISRRRFPARGVLGSRVTWMYDAYSWIVGLWEGLDRYVAFGENDPLNGTGVVQFPTARFYAELTQVRPDGSQPANRIGSVSSKNRQAT